MRGVRANGSAPEPSASGGSAGRAMTIGEAADASGVTAKLIRYYEGIGLVPAATRTENGYRVYTAADVQTLRFIKRARSLGFSIKRIEQLLALWHDRSRASAEVRTLALGHVAELEEKIHELHEMAETLRRLADLCRNDERPDCPILADLGRPEKRAGPAVARAKGSAPLTAPGSGAGGPRRPLRTGRLPGPQRAGRA